MKFSSKHPLIAVGVAVLLALLLPGCASTTLENEGALEGVTRLNFKKLVVFAPFADPDKRRAAEDELKAKITRVECIPSYTLLPKRADLRDLARVRTAVHATGADGIVLMRPTYYMTERDVTAGKTRNVTQVISTSFGGYYGDYYGAYAGDYEVRQFTYTDPDKVKSAKVLQIETTIYKVAGETRVWYGRLISKNPSNVKQLIRDAVDAIRATLVRDDLITPPAK